MTTIEAVVIIPITFSVIMLLIWTGLLFYNRNVLDQAASRAAIVGGQYHEKTNEEICNIVMERFAQYINGKTILLNDTQISVDVTLQNIKVNVKGQIGIPSTIILGGVYKENVWSINITKEAARLRPSSFIRTVSRVKNGLDNHLNNEEGYEEASGKEEL